MIAALIAICQAVGMLQLPWLFVRVRYPLLALLSLGLLVGLGVLLGSLLAALVAGVVCCLLLASWLAQTAASVAP